MAELEVQLSADIKTILKDLKRVRDELEKTGKSTDAVDDILGRFGNSAGRAKKKVANAVPTLQEFSRVIQDAPFGIQGVANNITQLTSNFGNLSKAAGGGRAAMKLVIGALSGPAGLLFVVSAATSLLVAFGDSLFSSANKAKELDDKLNKINDSFSAELSVNKEIQKSLELQGKSTEGILGARNAILKRQIEQVSLLIEEQRELLNVQKEANKTVTIFEAIGQELGGLFDKATKLGQLALAFTATQAKQLTNILGIQVDLSKYDAASKKDKEKEVELETKLNNLLAQKLGLENDILKNLQKQNEQRRVQLDPVQSNLQTSGLDFSGLFTSASSQIQTGVGNIGKVLSEQGQVAIQKALLFRDSMASVFSSDVLASSITQAFNGVGQALAQGQNVFSALGAGIIGAFGNFLSAFGQQLVSYGTAALAFSAVSKALINPITAGPAAAAAIAIGAALSIAGSALSSIASGGLGGDTFSGGGSQDFSGSSFSSSSSSGFGNGGTVVFEIGYDKLIGVLERGKQTRLRQG